MQSFSDIQTAFSRPESEETRLQIDLPEARKVTAEDLLNDILQNKGTDLTNKELADQKIAELDDDEDDSMEKLEKQLKEIM